MDSGDRQNVASNSPDSDNRNLRPGEQVAQHVQSLMFQMVTADLDDVSEVWQDHEKHCKACQDGWCCEVEQALINRMNFDLALRMD